MECLTHYKKIALAKNVTGADDTIECAKSCIVEFDHICRYARIDEALLHSFGFVIVVVAIVSTDEYVTDFASFS